MAPLFTCLACSVAFNDGDIQRFHYKTDWHRYNLKRKIAELPPVTEGEFHVKLDFQTKKKEEKHQDQSGFCQCCNKSFTNNNAHENHLKSKKHKDLFKKYKEREIRSGGNAESENQSKEKKKIIRPKAGYIPPVIDDAVDDDSDEWEDVSDDEEFTDSDGELGESEAIPPNFCLFCPHESVNIEDNIRHMSKSHSFFIPDFEYIIDLEAFLIYIGAKVGDGKVCLKCNTHSKQFRSTKACQAHMTDKGHCMIESNSDSMLEYADFYDYSASYPEMNNEEEDLNSELSIEENALSVDPGTMELILPSGARAGHRALKKYYNQNVVGRENIQNKTRAIIAGVNSQYKALGYHGTALSMVVRKDIEARKTQINKFKNDRMRIGVKANKLQKFFRKQQMYCG